MSHKHVIKDRLIRALLFRGYVEIKRPNTNRYRIFQTQDYSDLVFIGRGGACRTGPNITKSLSNPGLRKKLLQEVPE